MNRHLTQLGNYIRVLTDKTSEYALMYSVFTKLFYITLVNHHNII